MCLLIWLLRSGTITTLKLLTALRCSDCSDCRLSLWRRTPRSVSRVFRVCAMDAYTRLNYALSQSLWCFLNVNPHQLCTAFPVFHWRRTLGKCHGEFCWWSGKITCLIRLYYCWCSIVSGQKRDWIIWIGFLSRVSTLTRYWYSNSVRPSVRLSVTFRY